MLVDYGQDMRWGELGKKGLNKLVALLTNHTLNIVGKNKYKEEFVTCGGVALSNVNPSTLESKNIHICISQVKYSMWML